MNKNRQAQVQPPIDIGIDVSERLLTERRRNVRLAVPQLLTQAVNLADAASSVLQVLAKGLDWDLGVMWLADAPAQRLCFLEVWLAPSLQAAEFVEVSRTQTFEPGVGLPGRVWSTGRPAWISDVVADDNFPRLPMARSAGLHGAFAFPILAGSDVLGAIEFFSREVREPDVDLLEMMATVGGQIGQHLRRTEAEAELRRGEARKAAMLAAALDAIITIDHEERILEFNPAAERIFGYARAAALGRRLSELIIPPAYRAEHRRGMQHYLETGVGPVLGRRVELPAMPEVDGLSATREIRQREARRKTYTPIIAVTAHAAKGDQDRFLAAGMDGCLTKPLDRRQLAGVLTDLFPAEPSRPLPPTLPVQECSDGVDWGAVLARLEGNEVLLAEIIDLYVEEWPRLFAELREALNGGELGAVAFKAHRLNGLVRNFGVGRAATVATNVEALAHAGNGDAIRHAANDLQAACQELERVARRRRQALGISPSN